MMLQTIHHKALGLVDFNKTIFKIFLYYIVLYINPLAEPLFTLGA